MPRPNLLKGIHFQSAVLSEQFPETCDKRRKERLPIDTNGASIQCQNVRNAGGLKLSHFASSRELNVWGGRCHTLMPTKGRLILKPERDVKMVRLAVE